MALRGPIDFIVVGFEGNKFDGSILSALADAIDARTIGLVDHSFMTKSDKGEVATLNINDSGDATITDFGKKYKTGKSAIDADDIAEVADLLENGTSAGLLVIEQLWAKPLKEAIIKANGVLVSEGRIHPDAVLELTTEEN